MTGRDLLAAASPCPACGSPVTVEGDPVEGTSYFVRVVADGEYEALLDLEDSMRKIASGEVLAEPAGKVRTWSTWIGGSQVEAGYYNTVPASVFARNALARLDETRGNG